MTREEAAKNLCLMEHVESIVSTYEPGECWEGTTVRELKEACRMAVAVLRAQPAKLDRSRWKWKGCPCCWEPECDCCAHAARREELEPCKSCVKGYQESEGMELPGYVTANYCHHCGRPLTEESWAELERRIGGNDGTTDIL